jgi:hypothetical protein
MLVRLRIPNAVNLDAQKVARTNQNYLLLLSRRSHRSRKHHGAADDLVETPDPLKNLRAEE